MSWLETKFWQIAKWFIKRGYGANCDEWDKFYTLTNREEYDHWQSARCQNCRAKEIISWIDEHIDIIKY